MSVLKLRRDMVVVEDESETETVSEIEKPFPLRKFDHEHDQAEDLIEGRIEEEVDDEEEAEEAAPRRKTIFQRVKFWFNASAIVALLAAYPAFTIAASDVGDRNFEDLVNRADWAAPWAGSSASLLEQHFDELGWAPDAAAWEPMARLTAKPAYQEAMAGSLGDVIKLANSQSATPDADLQAAARLVNKDATSIQLRAARDALVNFDRRLRRRDELTDFTPAQVSEQLNLISAWAAVSAQQVNASASSIGGSPMDEDATRAVYAAKGRATIAYMVLGSMQWPESIEAAKARDAAMAAWRDVAKFHPLVVLNGDPDGSVFGNHAIAIGFLVARAEQATNAFAALVTPPAPAPEPAAAKPAAASAP